MSSRVKDTPLVLLCSLFQTEGLFCNKENNKEPDLVDGCAMSSFVFLAAVAVAVAIAVPLLRQTRINKQD